MERKCYVTTPIYYPNAKPHLGSAYTTISADFVKRLYDAFGYRTFFLTGTDEHGEKISEVAKKMGKSPQELVDEMNATYKEAWKKLNISYDRMIRTTEEAHKKIVREFLSKVYEKGDIYKGKYEGQYCVGCERYYTEKELIDGNCPYHLKPVENKSIEAYFFKLSEYKENLLSFYRENEGFLPEKYRSNIINTLDDIRDICISRPVEQVDWGIRLPFDEEHVAYVWFDALINYLSGVDSIEGMWPPDMHIMGKDIMWFHAVLWPAMLMSYGIELPRRILVHGFLTVDGKKMSKSLGNVVDPLEVEEKYSSDALRYYLLTKVSFGDDGDFSWKLFRASYANELIGHYGNLANRLVKLANSVGIEDGEYPREERLLELRSKLEALVSEYKLEEILRFYGEELWAEVTEINAYLNDKEPWRTKDGEARKVVGACLKAFVFISALLEPLIPQGAGKVLEAFSRERSIEKAGLELPEVRIESLLLYKKVED
ncbi:MAG: methionine--tRNA ligase [Methanobacteriota archaeon]|nr:MAG: methionine--tRNA ligase [Euryarchaeota archaeon]